MTSNKLWASVNFFWANHCQKICCFCVHSGAPDLFYPGTSLYEHILWMHLEKDRTYACTFPVRCKEINVVKVRFTMRFSSRRLSNDKVITTACNFWRQNACSFQVMSGNILFLGNKIFEIPPFFQTRPGDLGKKVHACSLRFSALKRGTRINLYDELVIETKTGGTRIVLKATCKDPLTLAKNCF